MMYVSKGILCKRKRRQWILIRQYDCLIKLFGEEAAAWEKGRLGFAYTHHRGEINVIQNLMKKGLVAIESGESEIDKYNLLRHCSIYSNPKFQFCFKFFNKTEKRILRWIKKAGTYLSCSELVALEDKGIKPQAELLYKDNVVKLMKILYPALVSISGDMESRMRYSIYRQSTVNAVMTLLRRKRVIIM